MIVRRVRLRCCYVERDPSHDGDRPEAESWEKLLLFGLSLDNGDELALTAAIRRYSLSELLMLEIVFPA